jgi:glycosyltransferase involved in cell wall biosynthesis
MPTAYLSPFVNETNDYINRMKEVLRGCGYDVAPMSFKTLLSPKAVGLFRSENIVLVHWLETRAFKKGPNGARIDLPGLLQVVIYLLVMAVMRARLVYFVHDHAVHDLTGWRRTFSVRLIELLRRMADIRVVHDPSYSATYNATYLPHPLYQDRDLSASRPMRAEGPIRAGILGAIRPYKRVEHIIDVWPAGPLLRIRGRCDPSYEQLLHKHIQARGPDVQIELDVGFMSREEFEAELNQLDALLLPHADESALVSGAFFEAIGATPLVIARTTPFIKWASTQFSGLMCYDQEQALQALLQDASNRPPSPVVSQRPDAQTAMKLFGLHACIKHYTSALQR